ncbi:methyltransferase-domain-containing protein [Biscogniauxia sp. FL1348]|nr:methyltransferase-domain-containing protein [Biscogniauxia sp. FL1348]
MFAVPGWAVSADGLKAETTVKQSSSQNESNNPKKRKRASVPANVTASNVADLWEQVIEGRSGKKSKPEQEVVSAAGQGGKKGLTLKEKKKLKKLKAQEEAGHSQPTQGTDKQTTESTDVGRTDQESKKKDKKKKKKDSKEGAKGSGDEDELAGGQAQAAPAPAPAAPKLTPLQAAMREKLVSARFRHLNETLYTKPSADAFQLFEDSPEMFQEYHEGFRRQVDVWPENPVDGYIEDIKQRGAQRTPHHQNHRRQKPGQAGDSNNSGSSSSSIQPLPRTGGSCTIADLGCGDAKLAAALQSDRKRLNLRVLSYDLQSPSPLITRADVANLPLADGAVDVAIFCLALMGTNWLDFIDEAYRILHWKGELWVAEIKSRFGPVGGSGAGGRKQHNNAGPVAHSVGNRRKTTTTTTTTTNKKKKNGKGKDDKDDDADDEASLAVVVDGAEDTRRQETDVSAFVEALRKRGFLLHHDDGAVDLRNKMFVKMRFVKAATPTVGKGAAAATAREAKRGGGGGGGGGNDMGAPKNRKKFIEAADEEAHGGALDENSILKPCVYKIR